LFVRHIDFREFNAHKNISNGFKVLGRAIYSREAQKKFGKLLDRFQPNIVHLQNIHAHITPSVVFEARKRRIPVVWTLHDYKLICPNSHFLIDRTGEICEACGKGAYYQPVLKRCKKDSLFASGMAGLEAYAHRMMRVREKVDAFLAPSVFMRDKLISRGLPADRIHHLPLFLPDAMLRNDSEDQIGGDYILYLGKLELIKGIRTLLSACRSIPRIRLILAGRPDESFKDELTRLIPPNVQYVGMKYGKELVELIQGALAIVLPSLWYENQPFSILEAFAFGKPVIASNLGGMAELVNENERGLLVPPGDANALCEAIRWLAEHSSETRKMGQAAQKYVAIYHSSKQHYQKLMDLYCTVINA
jgi:glycosyltransferase involved in cell wall biosynthesis